MNKHRSITVSILAIFSVILIGVISASALQHPELVEMKLEVYIFDVVNGKITLCVDVYCHTYYEGSGSISKTVLIEPGDYTGSLEWRHTKTGCATDFDNVCAASGKVVVPREKDGPLTIQVWNQYDLGAQVFTNQKITFAVTIPSFDESTPATFTIDATDSLSVQDEITISKQTTSTDLEEEVAKLRQEWEEFKTKTKDMFP